MIKEGDVVLVSYTGKTDGKIFDTTREADAKASGLHKQNQHYHPHCLVVGKGQLLPGLEQDLVGKEVGVEQTITLQPEQAFGKRDVKNIQMIPTSTFKEHKMQPQPGLSVDVDGRRGVVQRVAGGRAIVNFNHPLAGRIITYSYCVDKKIEDTQEQVKGLLGSLLHAHNVQTAMKDDVCHVSIPKMPEQVAQMVCKQLSGWLGKKIEPANA